MNTFERARAYLAGIPGAIPPGGHDQTYSAAKALVEGFDLSDDDALAVLRSDYNPRCSPPWTESELRHKVESARKNLDPSKVGCKVGGSERAGQTYTDTVHQFAAVRGFSLDAMRALDVKTDRQEVSFAKRNAEGLEVARVKRRGDGKPITWIDKNTGEDRESKELTIGKGLGLVMPWPLPEGCVLITEGIPDTLRALTAGHKAVIGTVGAKSGRVAVGMIQKLCTGREAVLSPHPDKAGQYWLEQIGKFLTGARVPWKFIPATDQDLDDRLKGEQDQSGALARLIVGAIPWQEPKPKPNDADLFRLTDLGNAERFKRQHGERVVYDPISGWRCWDGCRWGVDSSGEVHRLAHATARSLFEEAAAAKTPEDSQRIGQHAIRTQSRDRLRAMVDVARDLMTVDPRQFDTDPWFLNCQNGTLELKTGVLRPHRRENYITRLAPVDYLPDATHPVFEKVLHQAMPDPEVRRYAQKLFGITMIGEQVDDLFVLLYGPGGTAKTTMIEPFKKLLGDYGATVEPESLLVTGRGGGGGARGDIARLNGARLALTTEVEDGAKLAVGLVKRLSGGDTITARKLYRDEFEFVPRFTLWIVSNHRPKADSADDGLWRRVKVVPFDHVIPEADREPKVKQTMLNECLPAFLRWAVEGVRLYLEEGLKTPEVVKLAVEDYRDSQDPLKDFIDACCIIDPKARVDTSELRKAYLRFCEVEGARYPLGPRQFGERLRGMGFRASKSNGIRWLEGLDLDSGTQGTERDRSSVTFSSSLSYGKVTENDALTVPYVPETAARSFLDRMTARGIVVKLDGPRVNFLGRPTEAEMEEYRRLNGAVHALLAEREEQDLYAVRGAER